MSVVDIRDFILKDLSEGLQDVLDGKVKYYSSDFLYPDILVNYINQNGGEDLTDETFDTNGWQYDYWFKFKFKGKKFDVGGSGYYGGLSIELSEEEEDEE